MARRRRKAAKKAESESVEEVSSTGDTEDSTAQEEDSEGILDTTGQEENDEGEKEIKEEANNQETENSEKMVTDEVDTNSNENPAQEAETDAKEEEKIGDEDIKAGEKTEVMEPETDTTQAVAEDKSTDETDNKSTDEPINQVENSEQETENVEQMETDVRTVVEEKSEVQETDAGMDENDVADEDKSIPVQRVEKEPSSPECHDDDKCDVQIDPEADEDDEVIGSESPEFLKYWRAVLENPHDFTNWTYLLQLVDQENKPPLARRAYNGFFKRYPLCYGYWKKFSEMEKRNGNLVRAQRILERGVRAIPLSIDLWVHMIDFYITHYKGPDAGVEKVRKVFERAVTASGSEFRSEKLWNKYIQWEQENKNWKAVMEIYDRVLRIPTQHYSIFFKDYKDFVNSRSPKEILTYDDFEALLEEVRDEAVASSKAEEKDSKPADPEIDDDAPPGVEADDRGKPPNEKELKAVCEKVGAGKKKIFDETEALVTKIWTFEEGIKRPYFHVKALERTQIKNWRDYLEAEISRGEETSRIVLLFERCLIACALYEDFWLKYARFLSKTDTTAARNVYQRACEIHLPKKPNIHMHWAMFEELQGDTTAASKILENLDKTLPNMAMLRLRRVAVERRAGNIQAAEDLLKSFVTDASKGNECFYARKYAWFLVKASNKIDLARKVLKDVIERNQDQVQLYKDLVGLEFMYGDEEHFVDACDLAMNSQTLSEDVKFVFSQRKLEYLDDYGQDAKRVQRVYDDHQKLLRNHKKRTQSQTESPAQPTTKKAKTDSTGGSKILSTNSTRYSTSTATNGGYANPISSTVSGQPTSTAAQIQTATLTQPQQTYEQTASAGDASLYYQNYWNYQQKPAEAAQTQQYNYNQWPQYSQQQYYQQ